MQNAFMSLDLSRGLFMNIHYHQKTFDLSLSPPSLSEWQVQQDRGDGGYLNTKRAINRSRTILPVRVKTAIIRIWGPVTEKTVRNALVRILHFKDSRYRTKSEEGEKENPFKKYLFFNSSFHWKYRSCVLVSEENCLECARRKWFNFSYPYGLYSSFLSYGNHQLLQDIKQLPAYK